MKNFLSQSMIDDLFQNYINEIYNLIKQSDTREESFYHVLKSLLENYGQSFKGKTVVTVLPKKSEAGNPDFRVWDGENLITGYIEAKHPSESNLEHIENSEQLKRYREAYPNLILTNFLKFRLYRNGNFFGEVNIEEDIGLAEMFLKQKFVLNIEKLQKLLNLFFNFVQPKIKTPGLLAEILSKKAKIMRDYVILPSLDLKNEKYFSALYNSFKTYLIKDLTQKGFADLFAQTFTYGLFIAKLQYEINNKPTLFDRKNKKSPLPFTSKTAYDFIQKSFGILREVFTVFSTQDMPKNLEIIVDDIINILNHVDIKKMLIYNNKIERKDPIYHLYETFLKNYDPERKKKLGIYYTPPEIVSFMVNSVNIFLKDKNLFNAQNGLATYKTDLLENSVTLLDPLIVPYVVSHLKTLSTLSKWGFEFVKEDTLNIFLTNTLEFHRKEIGDVGLFESVLLLEQEKALNVKKQAPILIIIGNPPYSVSSQNKVDPETEFGKFYESYKKDVKKVEKNIQPLSMITLNFWHLLIGK